MNKYKRCKRGRDKKTMPAPDFPKIGIAGFGLILRVKNIFL